MNIEAMQNLIRVLEKVQNTQELAATFNLDDWMSTYEKHDYVDLKAKFSEDFADDEKRMLIPHKCGATACAIGYAGLDPWFRKQGLETSIDGDVTYVRPGDDPEDGSYDGFYAAAEILDIDADDAYRLFSDSSYDTRDATTPAQVIARVREVMAEYEARAENAKHLFAAPTGDE